MRTVHKQCVLSQISEYDREREKRSDGRSTHTSYSIGAAQISVSLSVHVSQHREFVSIANL
jgi:hypothetical protein